MKKHSYFHYKYHHLHGEYRTSSSLENNSNIEKKGFKLFVRNTFSIFTSISRESFGNFSGLLYLSKARAKIKPGKRIRLSLTVTFGLPGKS